MMEEYARMVMKILGLKNRSVPGTLNGWTRPARHLDKAWKTSSKIISPVLSSCRTQNQRVTQRHQMIWHIVHQRQDSVWAVSLSLWHSYLPSLGRGFILNWTHVLYMHQWSHCESPGLRQKNVKLELKSVTSGADSTSGALCTEALLCRLKSRSDGFSPHRITVLTLTSGWCGSSGWGFAGRPYLNCFLKATCEWHHCDDITVMSLTC